MAVGPALTSDVEHLLAHDAFVRGLAHQLIHDPEFADDVAQQAWLAAMQKPPTAQAGPSVRAFFAAVVRRLIGRTRRRERRELARQQAVAREPLVPSTAEILACEAQRAEVVRALLTLEPVYRDVVLLRFFEQLSPRMIAARLGVPVETVRTRQRRALAILRMRLDDQAGGRAAWIALLWPYGKTAVAPLAAVIAAKTFLLGVLNMSLQKLALLAVALAMIATAWMLMSPPPASLEPEAKPVAEAATLAETPATAAGEAPAASSLANPTAGQRTAVGIAEAASTGSLVVRVVFADGIPAPDVLVEASPRGGAALFHLRSARTDAAGSAHFARLSAGRFDVRLQRGGNDPGKSVDIVAGGEAKTELKLDVGMDVRGVVVDAADRPVAGAEIVIAGWTGRDCNALATTGADGTFALRAVATHCHIGARANGYATSPLRQFAARKGATVELRIVLDQVAAELSGVVVDSRQQPIAGALVRVGDPRQRMTILPNGGPGMGWRPAVVQTDANGAFVVPSLPPGRLPMAVRARGFGPMKQEVDLVAGRREQVRVFLPPGASVFGTVHAADGAPLAGVTIEAWQFMMVGETLAQSGDDGSFRLDDLPAGDLALRAESPTAGKAHTTLSVSSGQVLRWDPVLALGPTQRGRVVDEHGEAVAGARINAHVLRGGRDVSWWAQANTSADGRFELRDCPVDQSLRVEVTRNSVFREVRRDDVRWSPDELVITLPTPAWVHIVGMILGPDGHPLPNVAVSPKLKKGGSPWVAETADPATGAFRLGPYPPADYELRLSADGFVPMTLSHTLAAGETWDLGELRFARGGYVVVAPVANDPQLIADASFEVVDEQGGSQAFESQAGRLRVGPVRAGPCQLRVRGQRVAAVLMPITVTDGKETLVDVPLQRGVATKLSAVAPSPSPQSQSTIVEFAIRDASGVLLVKPVAYLEGTTGTVQLALAPGHYTVEATASGLRGRGEFDIDSDRATVTASIVLQPE